LNVVEREDTKTETCIYSLHRKVGGPENVKFGTKTCYYNG